MSWLFGLNKPQQQQAPPFPPGATAGGGGIDGASGEGDSAGRGRPGDGKAVGAQVSYSFDSTALERAAGAAKQLEKSKNAQEAFELTRMQEVTRQKEHERGMREAELRLAQVQGENAKMMEEARRRTLAEETKHHRARAEYQDQLARKRQEEDHAMKARMQEETLRKQEESLKRQEAIRKATIEHELQLRHKYDLERIEAEVRAKTKAARENRDVNLEMMKASEEESRKTMVERIRTTGAVVGTGLNEFISDKTKVLTAVGGVTALAVGWYTAKRGTGVVSKYVEARLGRPALVRETSRLSPFELFKHPVESAKLALRSRTKEDPLKRVVLNPRVESSLRDLAVTVRNTRTNNGFFRNVLFHGPPGTGKTMFAKSLARHSGLDYAVMTGGDVAPMGSDGVSAIHKIFDWAETSRKGLVLFIDEADAFLRKRSTEKISEDMRAMLNAFLYRTGEQSKKFVLVIASNQPEQFDWAVNDRLDEMVEFELPGEMERERILLQYFREFIVEPATSGSRRQRLKLADFDWIEKMKSVAKTTEGMSGRELSKLVFGWQASAYASDDGMLTVRMIDESTKEVVRQHDRKMEWLAMERAAIGMPYLSGKFAEPTTAIKTSGPDIVKT